MERKPIDLHDNAYLCALDMTQATDEQQIAWLTTIIDNELDRGADMDEDLICECAEHLELLSPDTSMSAEECEAHLQAFLATVNTPATKKKARTLPRPTQHLSSRLHKLLVRASAIAAVLIMVTVLTPKVYAYTLIQQDKQLYEEALGYDYLNMGEQSPPLTTDRSNKGAYHIVYSNVSDFFKDHEDLNFYYPHQHPAVHDTLPIEVSSVSINYHSENSWVVVFTYHEPNVKYFTVQRLAYPTDYTPPGDITGTLISSARKFTVSESETDGERTYEAVYTDGDLRYTVTSSDYDAMQLLLSSMWNLRIVYDSPEAFEAEWDHLQDFRYPSVLPEGMTFQSAVITYWTHTSWTVTFTYKTADDQNATYMVSRAPNPVELTPRRNEKPMSPFDTVRYVTTSITWNQSLYSAQAAEGKFKYSIETYSYDQLREFVDSTFGPRK